MSIKNDERKLKESRSLSKQSILDSGFISSSTTNRLTEERVFTGEFYKLYHESRLMLLRGFFKKMGRLLRLNVSIMHNFISIA